MNTNLLKIFFGASLFLVVLVLTPHEVGAKSATWSNTYSPSTWYRSPHSNDIVSATTTRRKDIRALGNPHVEVTYDAQIENATNGVVIAPGGSVPQGTPLTLRFTPHKFSHVYWFGTGYAEDSPYGEWRFFGIPGPVSCLDKDVVSVSGGDDRVHIPLVVNPPLGKSISGATSQLSCGSLNSFSGTMSCDTVSPGLVTPTFEFPQTYGYFYYRESKSVRECIGNNDPLTLVKGASAGLGGTKIAVPKMVIPYPLTVTGMSAPPSAPIVSDEMKSCPNHALRFSSTDPDGENVRFGIDWDKNGTVNEWFPATGYVNSGEIVTLERSFVSGSTQDFTVFAEDVGGMVSTLTTHSFIVPNCDVPPTVVLAADDTSITVGESTILRFEATANADTCVGTGFSTGGLIKGSVVVTPSVDTNYSVVCTNEMGSDSDEETILIAKGPLPSNVTLSGQCLVEGVTQSIIMWGSTNAISCDGSGFNTEGGTSGSASVAAGTYRVLCANEFGVTPSRAVTVAACTPAVFPTIDANTQAVRSGKSTFLNWNSGGATDCVVKGQNGFECPLTGGACLNQSASGVDSGVIKNQTTFTIACSTGSDTVTVRVIPSYKEI